MMQDTRLTGKAASHMIRSFWTLSGNPALLKSPPVIALAEKYGLSAAQVLFKFCQRSVQSIGATMPVY
jgi:hypothetical protein